MSRVNRREYEGKMEVTRLRNKSLGMRWISRVSFLLYCLGLVGCTTIKKAGVTATAAAVGATAGTVFSGGAIAPIAGAMTTAFVADVVTEVTDMSPTSTGVEMTCAPTNLFDIIEALLTTAGWGIIIVLIAPMLLGWILPGPLERKKK